MTVEAFGKYRVIEKIGAGGFGEVFKGLDPLLNRHVAIKTCSSEEEELRLRFFREAEIAANLQHPNIVTVYDFGYQDETPYLVQEYLGGEDLDHKINRRDPLDLVIRLDVLLQIATGLEYAHSRDVVHRDVKPGNIRVLDDGQVRIMDFGIAKLLTAQTQLTRTGMAMGTAAYLPPEQLRGEEVDPRGDQFSFGVLAYELMTFERPFAGDSLSAMLYAIAHKEPQPLAGRCADCPPRLAEVIETCLAKDPAGRYPGFGGIIAELRSLSAMTAVTGEGSAAVPAASSEVPPVPPAAAAAPAPPSAETPPVPTEVLTAATEMRPGGGGSRDAGRAPGIGSSRTAGIALLAVFAAGLLAAVGLGAWWLDRRFGEKPDEPPPRVARADDEKREPPAVPPGARPRAEAPAPPPSAAPPSAAPSSTAAPAPEVTRDRPATRPPPPSTRPPVERLETRPPPSSPPRRPRPATPSAPGPAPLVAGLPAGVETGQLAPGERVYSDRAFTFKTVPWNLRDLISLRTSNAARASAASLEFTLGRDAEVLVAHDLRIKDKPDWLDAFEDTRLAVTVDGDDDESKDRIYQVFARDFPAGVVTLGANAPPGSSGRRMSMYTVFVRPK